MFPSSGVYPVSILPCRIHDAASGEQKSPSLVAEIRTAVKSVSVGYSRIMRLSRCISQVRLKRYMEMSGADGGTSDMLCAMPAFWVPMTGLRTPFQGRLLRHVAEDVLQWVKDGLDRRGLNESSFLDPLKDVVGTDLPLLSNLNLNRCNITDDGCEKFSRLENLKVLNLGFNDITDACLAHLKGSSSGHHQHQHHHHQVVEEVSVQRVKKEEVNAKILACRTRLQRLTTDSREKMLSSKAGRVSRFKRLLIG